MNLDNSKSRSFFERPEGTLGMLVIAALILGGGYFLFVNMALIAAFMTNTLHAVIAGIVLFAIIAVLMNDNFRTAVWYLFQGAMRFFTGMVIQIDPIGILKSYIADMEKKLAEVGQHKQKILGQKRSMDSSIKEEEAEMQQAIYRAQKFQEKGEKEQAEIQLRKIGRTEERIKKYQVISAKMDFLHQILDKMFKAFTVTLADTKDRVEEHEREYRVLLEAHKAMTITQKFLSGNDSKKQMFEDAMMFIKDDIGVKYGELEDFMRDSEQLMAEIDLTNEGFTDRGRQILDKWSKSDSTLLGDDKHELLRLADNAMPNAFSMSANKPKITSVSDFSQY